MVAIQVVNVHWLELPIFVIGPFVLFLREIKAPDFVPVF